MKLLKILSSFFCQEEVKIPVWGIIPFNEMNGAQLIQFVDELSDAMVALSLEGFNVIYSMVDDPIIEIKSVNL